MEHLDLTAEVELVRDYIDAAEYELDALRIIPRRGDHYPFDWVSLTLLRKSLALSKATVVLIGSDFPDEAFGLSRSLVECALTFRYLTEEKSLIQERARRFVDFALESKSYWLYQALESFKGTGKEAEIRAYAEARGIIENKQLSTHWSEYQKGFTWRISVAEHPLDGPQTDHLLRKLAYAVDYQHASFYVHCSAPGIDNYAAEVDAAIKILPFSEEYYQCGPKSLILVATYLHSCLGYTMFGLNLARSEKLNSHFAETLRSLNERFSYFTR